MDSSRFRDRQHAGQVLADMLVHEVSGLLDPPGPLVLALPRGGVPVAWAIARALHAPLDLLLVRKLGVPGDPEFAMGALAEGGVRWLDAEIVDELGIEPAAIERVVQAEQRELERRALAYRGTRAPPAVAGRTVIVVDDGLATGATMRAAVRSLRAGGAGRIVVAVPIGARDRCERLRAEVDALVCAHMPPDFRAVSQGYDDFAQTADEEVMALLSMAWGLRGL